MYLKFLSRDSDKTNTYAGVKSVEFFHRSVTKDELRNTTEYCDTALISDEVVQTQYEKTNGQVVIGCMNVEFVDGGRDFIIFDGVAFLCNETGKAVERYVAN